METPKVIKTPHRGRQRKYDDDTLYEDKAKLSKYYHTEYYQNNKEAILNQQREKCKCDVCGNVVRKSGLQKHKLTKKCHEIMLFNQKS